MWLAGDTSVIRKPADGLHSQHPQHQGVTVAAAHQNQVLADHPGGLHSSDGPDAHWHSQHRGCRETDCAVALVQLVFVHGVIILFQQSAYPLPMQRQITVLHCSAKAAAIMSLSCAKRSPPRRLRILARSSCSFSLCTHRPLISVQSRIAAAQVEHIILDDHIHPLFQGLLNHQHRAQHHFLAQHLGKVPAADQAALVFEKYPGLISGPSTSAGQYSEHFQNRSGWAGPRVTDRRWSRGGWPGLPGQRCVQAGRSPGSCQCRFCR